MVSSKTATLCDRIVEAGWIAAAILAPLYFNGYSSTVMDTDKLIVVQALAGIMSAAWSIHWLETRKGPVTLAALRPRTPLTVALVLLAALNLLTTLTSIFPRASFFGAYHRPSGWLALFPYLLIFAMTADGLRTRERWNRLAFTIILSSLPVALYAFVQYVGLDPLNWSREDFGGRVASTLGNPIFMAGYLLMPLMLALARTINSFRDRNLFRAALYAIILLVQSLAIIFSASRGPWLGWAAGLYFFGILVATLSRKRHLVFSALIFGAGLAGILVLLNVPNSPLAFMRDAPGIGRMARLSDATAEFRLSTWSDVARLVAPHAPLHFPDGTPDALNAFRPLVGYGADTLALVYPQVAAPNPALIDRVTDHSHNETWDVLVTGGILGLAAYEFLFFAIFLSGLSWLGLVSSRRERILFAGLWIGLAFLGALAAAILGFPGWVGLAIPAGNAAGTILYFAWIAHSSPDIVANRAHQTFFAALLAAVFAHFIEIQFGINLVASQTTFWIIAAMLYAAGSGSAQAAGPVASVAGKKPEPMPPISWKGQATAGALIVALVVGILFFEFIVYVKQDALQIFWQSLTFNPVTHSTSYAILGLVLGTAALGAALVWDQLTHSGTLPSSSRLVGLGWIAIATAVPALVFGIGLSRMIGALVSISSPVKDLQDVLALAGGSIGILDYSFVGLVSFIALSAAAMGWNEMKKSLWVRHRSSVIAMALIPLATGLWVNSLVLNPMRADAVFRLAQSFGAQKDWNAAIVLYTRAFAMNSSSDTYAMALGDAFSHQASIVVFSVSSAHLNNQTTLREILNLNVGELGALNRGDLVYATQLVLLRAHDLNPLYLTPTLDLARFYIPELPLNSPSKQALAALSEKYFSQAARLSPNDPRVWNEWADFELKYRDANAALEKLNEFARRVPQFAETFLKLGDVYQEMNDLSHAAVAYRRAASLDPAAGQPLSKLAFVYYEQNNLSESVQSYQAYIALAPDAANAWEARKNLALIYQSLHDRTHALEQAEFAARLAPAEYREQLSQLVEQLRLSAP